MVHIAVLVDARFKLDLGLFCIQIKFKVKKRQIKVLRVQRNLVVMNFNTLSPFQFL